MILVLGYPCTFLFVTVTRLIILEDQLRLSKYFLCTTIATDIQKCLSNCLQSSSILNFDSIHLLLHLFKGGSINLGDYVVHMFDHR